MEPFLKQLAAHYFKQDDIENTCFIFPNRRARSFFKKWLCAEISNGSDRPVVTPVMMTMGDFFCTLAGEEKSERVSLLLELYGQYRLLNPKAESLDDFIFWGDVLLSDFDDVDKYLVNADSLFSNVADFKNIQDSYSYLSEGQKDAIERFLAHFRNDGGAMDYKRRFLQIWNLLLPLYRNFNSVLEEKGLSYEGRIYRNVARQLEDISAVDLLSEKIPRCSRFVFAGLNALNECERRLMGRMKNAGIAEFCWDFSSDLIRNSSNKSSFFLAGNVERFGQDFTPDAAGLPTPEINVLSVPGGIAMAKQLPEILKRVSGKGLETAVILPDEGLLLPVLNSIPEDIEELNVTMGYPMGASEFWSLMTDIASMQLHLRSKDGEWFFYHKQLWAIFSNSVFKSILSEEAASKVEDIRKKANYYVSEKEFAADGLLSLIFRPAVKNISGQSPEAVKEIEQYQKNLIAGIASALKENPEMSVELDFAREFYLAVEQLGRYELPILPATYFKLLSQIVGSSAIPFEGEPLKGLQIMGPLETRALDFENVIILSCNEGMFPRRSVSSSFIPPELRKGFGLPTYEFQDAVWAYYFYRLIQRAGKVWMLYDSRSEGLRGGEESRYIKQLELHFKLDVHRYVLSAPMHREEEQAEIPKTEEHLKILHSKDLSASALQTYLCCPAKFFYQMIEGLEEEEEVNESLDAGTLGNVFHKTMEELYSGKKTVSAGYLDDLISKPGRIHETVASKIKEQLHCFEISGRNIIFEDIVCRYVLKVLRRDRELMDSYGCGEFTILGLELKKKAKIDGFGFKGFIDRLDSFTPGEIRVVDYKTGKISNEDFFIDDDNAEAVVDALFGDRNDKRPKIALQLYLYDRFISPEAGNRKIVNSIYQTSRLFTNEVENVELCPKFCSLMEDRLSMLLRELDDLSVAWTRKGDEKSCSYCDFRMICGK